MKTFAIGDEHKRISCPDRYLADQETDDTIIISIPAINISEGLAWIRSEASCEARQRFLEFAPDRSLKSIHPAFVFRAIKMRLLAIAKTGIPERPCVRCGQKFKPHADRAFATLSDFHLSFSCPKCGYSYTGGDLDLEIAKANPPGPFERPHHSLIRRKSGDSPNVSYFLPKSGRWGIWLPFAVFWNLITWTFAIVFAFAAPERTTSSRLPYLLILPTFIIVGLGLIYAALRHRYGATQLELTPERIRLQRTLFGKQKNRDLPMSDVTGVSKTCAYSVNYQPVYCIEIKSRRRWLRFGTTLTDDEKNWLCFEICEFIRVHGRQMPENPTVEAFVRNPGVDVR
jgi:hypothetical protein